MLELSWIQKHSLTTQRVHTFIELAYCAVNVKRDIVHWYFHTISVVWNVQMDIRIGGSFFWLDLCPSQHSISLFQFSIFNVTSSCLHSVVWYSQTMSMPAFVRIILLTCSIYQIEYLNIAKAGAVFYSPWNLDIFHSILPNIYPARMRKG